MEKPTVEGIPPVEGIDLALVVAPTADTLGVPSITLVASVGEPNVDGVPPLEFSVAELSKASMVGRVTLGVAVSRSFISEPSLGTTGLTPELTTRPEGPTSKAIPLATVLEKVWPATAAEFASIGASVGAMMEAAVSLTAIDLVYADRDLPRGVKAGVLEDDLAIPALEFISIAAVVDEVASLASIGVLDPERGLPRGVEMGDLEGVLEAKMLYKFLGEGLVLVLV